MLDWLIIVFVFFVSSVSWGLFVFLSWARKWPKVDVALGDMDVKKYKIQGKIYYRPAAKYIFTDGQAKNICRRFCFSWVADRIEIESQLRSFWDSDLLTFVRFFPGSVMFIRIKEPIGDSFC
ncbi:hypothetical protein GN155_012825 [Alcanivorax sp. ZXX171]|nr:hypothetical protein [Alcanivorax sp. ZXX171]